MTEFAGRDGGHWVVAHAIAMSESRPQRTMIARLLTVTAALTAVGATTVAALGDGGVRLAGVVAAVLFATATVWLYRELWGGRRNRILDADLAATRATSVAAAHDAMSPPQMYRTAAHQWWERRSPLSPRNRLNRLI